MAKPSSRNLNTDVSPPRAGRERVVAAIVFAQARLHLVQAPADVVDRRARAIERLDDPAELDHLGLQVLHGLARRRQLRFALRARVGRGRRGGRRRRGRGGAAAAGGGLRGPGRGASAARGRGRLGVRRPRKRGEGRHQRDGGGTHQRRLRRLPPPWSTFFGLAARRRPRAAPTVASCRDRGGTCAAERPAGRARASTETMPMICDVDSSRR